MCIAVKIAVGKFIEGDTIVNSLKHYQIEKLSVCVITCNQFTLIVSTAYVVFYYS